MSESNKNEDTLAIQQLAELITAIKKTQAEVTYAAKAFDGNTKLAINELKEAKTIIAAAAEELKAPISLAEQNIDKFDSVTSALAIIPDKIEDKLAGFPKTFNESIANSIPGLGEELCKSIDTILKSGIASFKIYQEEIMRNTNRAMNEYEQKLRKDAIDINNQISNDLRLYTEAFDKIIDRSDRFRMRRFFWTLLLSGGFSAMITIVTFWFMGKF